MPDVIGCCRNMVANIAALIGSNNRIIPASDAGTLSTPLK